MADKIEEAILDGSLSPGEEVPQLKLAKQLGISQAATREGLQELEYRRLVVKHGRTKTVTNFSEQDVADMFQVRLRLEPFACRLAATTFSEDLSREIDESFFSMQRAADAGNTREHLRADLRLHRAIWKHQPNRQLEYHLNLVCSSLFAYELVRRGQADVIDYTWNLRQTRIIVMALRTRDGDLAERVARRITDRFYRRYLSDYFRLKPATRGTEDQLE